MRVRVAVIGLVVVALVGGGMAVRARGRTTPPPASAPAQVVQSPVTVTVAAARRADIVARVLAPGSVTSIRDAKIGSKISGRVAVVLVEEGQRVSAGAPLLRLDTGDLIAQEAQAQASAAAARARLQEVVAGPRPEERRQSVNAVGQAQAGLRSAQAQLDLAEANVQRMRSLHTQGAVSKQDLDSAETQVRVAQAQVVQAKAALDSAQQNWRMVDVVGSRPEDIQQARAQLAQAEAGLAMIRVQLRDSTISAPFTGTITQRNVEPGEVVSPQSSTALFTLSQIADVYVELAVPEEHRSKIRPGQEAQMQIDALPGRTFRGRIEDIRPAAVVASRSFGVKVRVPNPDGALRPGMFARGAIIVGVRPQVLEVPERAVVAATSGSLVFVVKDGRAVRQPVALGERSGDGFVEITSGLSAGDQVVVEGQEGLSDNQPVTPRP
jgi:HlyD family secretion protein